MNIYDLRRKIVWTLILVSVSALVISSGCSQQTMSQAPSVVEEPLPPVEIPPYQLQRGDVVAFRFWGNPELDEEMTIRPDGMVALPFVDEVRAAGKSPAELDAELTRLYSNELVRPDITVIVRDAVGQQVYVGGEVREPGLYDLRGQMSAMQAITLAGGFEATGRRREVLLIRTYPDGQRIARSMDLLPVLTGAAPDTDVRLQVADIVFVPRSKIKSFGVFVEQYIDPIYKLIPIRFVSINPFAE